MVILGEAMNGSLLQLPSKILAARRSGTILAALSYRLRLGYCWAGIVISETGLERILGDPTELRDTGELGVAIFFFWSVRLCPGVLWRCAIGARRRRRPGADQPLPAFNLLGTYDGLLRPPCDRFGAVPFITAFACRRGRKRGELRGPARALVLLNPGWFRRWRDPDGRHGTISGAEGRPARS